jgi:parallel beta-helix repeat protein
MNNIQIIKVAQTKTYIDEVLNASENNQIFMLEKGNYYLRNPIRFENKKNITVRSITGNPNDVSIIQEGTFTNPDTAEIIHYDGLIINNSEYITIDCLTLSVNKTEGNPICAVCSGSDHIKITNSRFYGSNNNFCIYFSGPSDVTAGQETIDAYNSNTLCRNNIFEKNMVISYFVHDSLVFALQSDGIVRNNIVYGCRIAIYMVRDTICYNNYSYNSTSNGITCSVPCHNLDIANNVIRNSASTGINFMEQLEHGDTPIDVFNINIVDNTVVDCLNGIDVIDCKNCNVKNNSIRNSVENGITTLKSEFCDISDNKVINCTNGINVSVDTYNCKVNNNVIYNYNPLNSSKNGIKLEKNTGDNEIKNNILNINDQFTYNVNDMVYIIDYDAKDDENYIPDTRINVIENNNISNDFNYYDHIITTNL